MKQICRYMIPSIVYLFFNSLYGFADSYFTGMIGGDNALSAVNIAWPIAALFYAFAISVSIAGGILYSKYKGLNDDKKSQTALLTSLKLLFAISVIMLIIFIPTYKYVLQLLGASDEILVMAIDYIKIIIYGCPLMIFSAGSLPLLRNKNMPVYAMISSLCGMATNLIFNYVFIVVLNMGMAGASLGTICAHFIICSICAYPIIKHIVINKNNFIKAHSTKIEILKEICKTALSPFGLELAPSIVLVFCNLMYLQVGSVEALSSFSLISVFVFILTSMLRGIADSLQPIISLEYANNNHTQVHKAVKVGVIVCLSISIVAGTLLCTTSTLLASAFNLSQSATQYFSKAVIFVSIALPFLAITQFTMSYSNATCKSIFASKLTYLETLIISPICIFAFGFGLGVTGLWISYPATLLIMATLCLVLKRKQILNSISTNYIASKKE